MCLLTFLDGTILRNQLSGRHLDISSESAIKEAIQAGWHPEQTGGGHIECGRAGEVELEEASESLPTDDREEFRLSRDDETIKLIDKYAPDLFQTNRRIRIALDKYPSKPKKKISSVVAGVKEKMEIGGDGAMVSFMPPYSQIVRGRDDGKGNTDDVTGGLALQINTSDDAAPQFEEAPRSSGTSIMDDAPSPSHRAEKEISNDDIDLIEESKVVNKCTLPSPTSLSQPDQEMSVDTISSPLAPRGTPKADFTVEATFEETEGNMRGVEESIEEQEVNSEWDDTPAEIVGVVSFDRLNTPLADIMSPSRKADSGPSVEELRRQKVLVFINKYCTIEDQKLLLGCKDEDIRETEDGKAIEVISGGGSSSIFDDSLKENYIPCVDADESSSLTTSSPTFSRPTNSLGLTISTDGERDGMGEMESERHVESLDESFDDGDGDDDDKDALINQWMQDYSGVQNQREDEKNSSTDDDTIASKRRGDKLKCTTTEGFGGLRVTAQEDGSEEDGNEGLESDNAEQLPQTQRHVHEQDLGQGQEKELEQSDSLRSNVVVFGAETKRVLPPSKFNPDNPYAENQEMFFEKVAQPTIMQQIFGGGGKLNISKERFDGSYLKWKPLEEARERYISRTTSSKSVGSKEDNIMDSRVQRKVDSTNMEGKNMEARGESERIRDTENEVLSDISDEDDLTRPRIRTKTAVWSPARGWSILQQKYSDFGISSRGEESPSRATRSAIDIIQGSVAVTKDSFSSEEVAHVEKKIIQNKLSHEMTPSPTPRGKQTMTSRARKFSNVTVQSFSPSRASSLQSSPHKSALASRYLDPEFMNLIDSAHDIVSGESKSHEFGVFSLPLDDDLGPGSKPEPESEKESELRRESEREGENGQEFRNTAITTTTITTTTITDVPPSIEDTHLESKFTVPEWESEFKRKHDLELQKHATVEEIFRTLEKKIPRSLSPIRRSLKNV